MINSTLTPNNFFVLRLRDPNPFDSENLDVGNSFNKKKWVQPPSDPKWGGAKHGHNLKMYFLHFSP